MIFHLPLHHYHFTMGIFCIRLFKKKCQSYLRRFLLPLAFLLIYTLTFGQTSITSDITVNTTWNLAGSPYSIDASGGIDVATGVTLTIDPGVTVTFANNNNDLTVNGTLIADGGPGADTIRFQDNLASVLLSSSSTGSIVDHARFENMGVFNIAALHVSSDATITNSRFVDCEVGVTAAAGASPVIQDCEMFSSTDFGVRIDNGSPTISNITIDGDNATGAGGVWIQQGTPSITNSSFQNIGSIGGIWLNTTSVPIIDNNSFTNNTVDIVAHPMTLDDENFDNNGLSVVHIDNENITSNTTWQAPQVPENWVYSTVNSLSVDPGVTLTVEPGVEIQFAANSNDITINGTLLAQGTVSEPISFNSNGASIFLSSLSRGSIFDYVKMEQMGFFNVAALAVSSDATVSNSIFDQCEVGISVDNSAALSVESTVLSNSTDFGMLVLSGSPTINNSAIYDNPTGVNNTGAGTVLATSNWWGDATGPTHLSNPAGTGDIVSDNVDFSSFLLENSLEPNAPSSLNITEISNTQIDLVWTDNSTTETGFSIERSDGNNSSYIELGTVGANTSIFSDNNVTAENGYFYRVHAVQGAATSTYTNERFGGTISPPGNALLFDGADDEVTFSEPIQTIYSDFTIEFWAKVPVTNSGQHNYFVQEDPAGGGTPQVAIAATFNNTMYFFLRETTGGTNSFAQGTTPINDDKWHHLAYVREGTSLQVYLDGELDGSASVFAGDIVFPGTAVGNLGGDATLDEFRFWDTALDIDQLRSFGSVSLDGTESSLSSYYRFDQDEATDLNLMDRSTSTINGIWSDGRGGTTEPQWVASGAFSADLFPPTAIAQNISVSLDAAGNVSITTTQVDNGSNDNQTAIGDLILALDISVFDCTDIGANTVVLTVTDEAGKSATSSATVTILDDLLPITSTIDISVSLDAAGNATIVPADVDNGSSDNCSVNLSLDLTTFDCTDVGANTVTLTATDNAGNSTNATATVTVVDNMDPVVIAQDISVSLDASGNVTIAPAEVDNGSSDNCTADLNLDSTSFDCTDIGANTVSLTVTDNAGNNVSTTAIVTVVDDLAPITVTQDISVVLDVFGNAAIVAADVDNGSSDNCSVNLSLDITNFDCANIGVNTVMLTSTDDAGNSTDATAIVTVNDNSLPAVLTQDVTVILDTDGLGVITTGDIDNGTTDNCTFTLSLDITDFTTSELGTNTVTLTATDASGNAASNSAIVTVQSGNLPPDFFFTYFLDENSLFGKRIGTVVATDPEGDLLTYTILSGNTNDAFAIGSSSGDLTVNSQEALDFETTPVFNLNVQADDGNGGISMVSITINLNDLNEEMVTAVEEDLEEIRIYPNPAHESLYIELNGFSDKDFLVKMFTVSGKQVLNVNSITAHKNVLKIDLRGLSSGIYLLKIQHQEVSVTKNVFVK